MLRWTESAKRGAHVTSIRMSNNCYVISWSWSYDNWIYNYLCNQCLSSLTLGVRITNVGSSNPAQARCTRYNSMWLSLSVTCDMSDVFPVSSTNNTDCYDIPEILLKRGVKHHNPNVLIRNIHYCRLILIIQIHLSLINITISISSITD